MILISFVPLVELRGGVPFGMFGNGGAPFAAWWVVFAVCVIANVAAGIVAFEVMAPVVSLLRRWGWFDQKMWPIFDRMQQKLKPSVDKYGEWGVALFIGIPLPGTGAYSGAVGSYLLGLPRKKFYVANLLGVLGAGIIVMALCLAIQEGVLKQDSFVSRLFMKKL
ncbi:MAG: small multi-drug export protein [Kiritimatiellaeota bacterium]|nr:small multi-drug export protein [Kiritimatiellota bacterium]